MTGRELIKVLAENVRFPPATANKRFVRDMAERPMDYVLSDRAEKYAWRIAYFFRRQLPKNVALEAVSRKVDHIWTNIGGHKFLLECEACKAQAYHRGSRNLNGPCPGPPEPKPPKKTQRRSAAEQGAVPVAESPIVAPNLFETEAQS